MIKSIEILRNEAVAECHARLAELDAMFADATGWGSWMVEVANEREALVNKMAREYGVRVPHAHLARTPSGGKVS